MDLVAGLGLSLLFAWGLFMYLGAGDTVGGQDVEEIGFGEGEAEGAEGDAQFVVVEVAVAV